MLLKTYYQKIISNLSISKPLRFFLYILIFFQPFNRFNSFREVAFYGLLLLFIMNIFKDKTIRIDFRDNTIVALSLLVGWSILVSILGPYPLDSLNTLRKNLLVQIIIFLVIITEFKSHKDLRTLFRIVAASFAIVTLASIAENFLDLINLNMDINALQSKRTHKMFIAGYASNATFYLPFIAVWLIAFREKAWAKWTGIIILLTGLIIVFLYNSITPLITIAIAILIIFFLSKRHKQLTVFFMICILILIGMILSYSSTFLKYKSVLRFEAYYINLRLDNRFAVWQGALHIIGERPFTGYGYGWKKMALAIKDSNIQEYWKQHYPYIYKYYMKEASAIYGKINPHNLILQIVFEIGLIGLGSFLWFWTTIISKIFKAAFPRHKTEIRDFMRCSIGIVISYILINITNGYWQEAYGNIIFMFIATIFVIYKQHAQRKEDEINA